MKRALLVGIDHYEHAESLVGCVNDAEALRPLLAYNEDDTVNFSCKMLLAEADTSSVTRDQLMEQVRALLGSGGDFALLYFAGHGTSTRGDVALATSESQRRNPGVRFSEVLEEIENSPVREVVAILDCCFSGGAGTVPLIGESSHLRSGVSILAASRSDQVSIELEQGRGNFSTFLEGALDGGAADVLGHVTVAGLYSYLSESFGAWEQRPTFKANVDRLHDLRRCNPAVPLATLRNLCTWFAGPNDELPLDPSYEPDAEPSHPENEKIFEQLQKCRASKLVEPVGEAHMYFSAINSKSCRLTPLGRHYWEMAKAGQL